MKKVTAAALLAIASASPSIHAADGPFGLAWGMTASEVIEQGFTLTEHVTENGVTTYGARKLPRDAEGAQAYALLFDHQTGLQRVSMLTEPVHGDDDGMHGKVDYALQKMSLTRQLGEPVFRDEQAGKTYQIMPHEFYPCLTLPTCGNWMSVFDSGRPGERVVLMLNGYTRGTGYVSVNHEGPRWADIVDRFSIGNEQALYPH